MLRELGHAEFSLNNLAKAFFLPKGEKLGHEEANPNGIAADNAEQQYLDNYKAATKEIKKEKKEKKN